MEVIYLVDEMEHLWRMVFEDNEGGIYDGEYFLYAKRWYVYMI